MVNDHISAQKIMIIIFWRINGFFIVDLLPIWQSYNSSYFVENILQPLFENKEIIWKESTKRKLWIHLDNSHVHTSKLSSEKYAEYGFKKAPHPAYSPDVAPCDFYLFGFI